MRSVRLQADVVGRFRPAKAGRYIRYSWHPSIGVHAAGDDARQCDRARLRRGGGFRTELQLRHAALAERIHQSAANDFVHERLFAEPHLRLRRVDVDVHGFGRHLDEEVHLGAALFDRRHAVGGDDRVRDRPILDDAPVDEDVLRSACRPLVGERRDVPGQSDAAGVLADFEQVGPFAVQLKQPIAHRDRRRALDHCPPRARQRETDLRMRERQLGDHARDLRALGAVRLQELPPRRQVVEDVADLDARPLGSADLSDRCHRSAVDADFGAGLLSAGARPEREMRHRRNGRQRLSAKSHRGDRGEVVGAPDLARRMPLEREPRILRLHPLSVVVDADLFLAAKLDVNGHARRTGVDRVLDELLDDRGWALDDFACGNLVGEVGRQPVDLAHATSSGGCPRVRRRR